jgi:hypothetical protein
MPGKPLAGNSATQLVRFSSSERTRIGGDLKLGSILAALGIDSLTQISSPTSCHLPAPPLSRHAWHRDAQPIVRRRPTAAPRTARAKLQPPLAPARVVGRQAGGQRAIDTAARRRHTGEATRSSPSGLVAEPLARELTVSRSA